MKNPIVIIITLVIFVVALGVGFLISDQSLGRAPEQPINFSHRIHAGDNEIPCMYCHSYAERARVSGVPNVQRCMGCHKIIKPDSPEIQKVAGYWERKEPIPWIKVMKS